MNHQAGTIKFAKARLTQLPENVSPNWAKRPPRVYSDGYRARTFMDTEGFGLHTEGGQENTKVFWPLCCHKTCQMVPQGCDDSSLHSVMPMASPPLPLTFDVLLWKSCMGTLPVSLSAGPGIVPKYT